MPKFVTATDGIVVYAVGLQTVPTPVQIEMMLTNGTLGPALSTIREQMGLRIRAFSLPDLWTKACDLGVIPALERGRPVVEKLPIALLTATTDLKEDGTIKVGTKYQPFFLYQKAAEGLFLAALPMLDN